MSTLIYILYHFWHSLFQRSSSRTFDEIDPLKLHKFTYKELKSATNGFNPENAIGKGGSGSVFRGILRDGKSVAVKKLDPSASLQAEKEFQNELTILGGIKSPHIVSLLGYCVYKKKRILVYEYMPNRSLQDLLFCDGNSGLGVVGWDRRFQIIQDVARGLEFLHNECDPPVIHGDIKPSNVLLDWDFRAKVSDFGLSRLKLDDGDQFGVDLFSQELDRSQELVWKSQELSGNLSVEIPLGARTTVVAQGTNNGEMNSTIAVQASSSSKNGWIKHDLKSSSLMNMSSYNGNVVIESDSKSIPSPKGKEVLLRNGVHEDELCGSVEHSKDEFDLSPAQNGEGLSKQWGKDWWWKQDGSGELCSKDYVMEWIGSQICPTTGPDWDEAKATRASEANLEKPSTHPDASQNTNECQQGEFEFDCHHHHHLNDGEEKHTSISKSFSTKEPKRMQDWWKEENIEEISSKKASRKKSLESRLRKGSCKSLQFHIGQCFHMTKRSKWKEMKENPDDQGTDISFRICRKKNKTKTPSMSSEMWSGDLFSRELSSTTSVRGTLCYAAPEYGGCSFLMEKTDIYSLGVLILVMVSGRRPLNLLNAPMKLEKANLVSWCRQLAQAGNVLELVDERLKGMYNKEQATLCINLALACLQRMPELRPDIGDIVRILEGAMDLPQLPFEFSPSPPCKLSSRSRRQHQKSNT